MTCSQSSRVGTRIRPRGRRGVRRFAASPAMRGMPKASVLPEPVWLLARMSRPARASGRLRAWMAKGLVKPRRASPVTSAAGRPYPPKSLTSGAGRAAAAARSRSRPLSGACLGLLEEGRLLRPAEDVRGRWLLGRGMVCVTPVCRAALVRRTAQAQAGTDHVRARRTVAAEVCGRRRTRASRSGRTRKMQESDLRAWWSTRGAGTSRQACAAVEESTSLRRAACATALSVVRQNGGSERMRNSP